MTNSADRAAVNAAIKTLEIRGKQYAEVPQRIMAFWKLHPDNGAIITEWPVLTDKWAVCIASVLVDGAKVAMGTAFEVREGKINSTSYIENCETSAIGRALGIYGIGTDNAVASAQELLIALNAQEEGKDKGKRSKSPVNATEQPQTTIQDESPMKLLEDARARYHDALAVYADTHEGADIAEIIAKHEAFIGKPFDAMTVEELARLTRAVAKR